MIPKENITRPPSKVEKSSVLRNLAAKFDPHRKDAPPESSESEKSFEKAVDNQEIHFKTPPVPECSVQIDHKGGKLMDSLSATASKVLRVHL